MGRDFTDKEKAWLDENMNTEWLPKLANWTTWTPGQPFPEDTTDRDWANRIPWPAFKEKFQLEANVSTDVSYQEPVANLGTDV